jgi:hypothetical protein
MLQTCWCWRGALLSVLMRPFCYYRGKAKLAGLFGVPLFLLVLIGGFAGYQYAESNITPATVVVREYVKSDGTHVSGYNRRPPGSVPHDQPYEYIQFSAFIAILGATFWTGRSIYRFIGAPPLSLLPPLDPALLPALPIDIVIPVKTATARKLWSREDCDTGLRPGATYSYYESGCPYTRRHRYCGPCAAGRGSRGKEISVRRREYSDAVAKARRRQCLSFYGLPPESLRNNQPLQGHQGRRLETGCGGCYCNKYRTSTQ